MHANPFLPHHPAWQWLADGLSLIGWLGLALAGLVGLGLLLAPRQLLAWDARSSRWVDTQESLARIDRRAIRVERWIYRHHRWVGACLVFGAAYCLKRWWLDYDGDAFLRNVAPGLIRGGLDWLVTGLEAAFVLFSGLALVIGGIMFVRPSLLKSPEAMSNRSIEVAPRWLQLDRRVEAVTVLANRYPRPVGAVILLISFAVTWMLI